MKFLKDFMEIFEIYQNFTHLFPSVLFFTPQKTILPIIYRIFNRKITIKVLSAFAFCTPIKITIGQTSWNFNWELCWCEVLTIFPSRLLNMISSHCHIQNNINFWNSNFSKHRNYGKLLVLRILISDHCDTSRKFGKIDEGHKCWCSTIQKMRKGSQTYLQK